MNMDDLANRFRFHPANEKKAGRHQIIRQKCFELACELNSLLPDGREKSVAMTNLEDVMFWSNAAIARYKFDEDDYSVKQS